MRRALLLLVMLAGLALVAWSGLHNLRARRTAQQMQANRIALIPEPAPPEVPSTLKGKYAPAFTLADLTGKQVSLADFHGHPLVLNFWGTYCGPCKIEMPWLEQFSHTYAAAGLKVVGITYDAEVGVPSIAKAVQQLGVTYPILLSDTKAEKAYLSGSEVLPMSFYVDKSGKVIEITAGLGSKDQLEAMVKETVAAGAQ